MKSTYLFATLLFLALGFLTTSCSDDDPITIDSSVPQGAFTASSSASLTAENMTPTTGDVELGTDDENTNFMRFADNFTTQLATGTVGVYLSTSAVFTADPENGNPDIKLVGSIFENGEQYIKLSSAPEAKYTHVILWCNSASIPFGNGEFK